MDGCLGENTVVDLVEAMLEPHRREAIERHTARCDRCRRVVSALLVRTHAEDAPPSRAPRELAPGAQIGRYRIVARIGSGATGAVFSAHDPELDRTVALKLLHAGAGARREQLQREARALARLTHPNVVAVFDFGEHDDDVFLAMELVEGTDLRTWVSAGRTVDAIVDAYAQAGRGLAAAHAVELVHRDFKPDNVVVGHDGRVRVVDFGLAARRGGTEWIGTPAYMAPEQLEAGGGDAASDQFAFCVALWEALFGRRPFEASFVEEIARGLPPTTRAVPARIRTALARGLAADPQQRYPSMVALVDALARRSTRAWWIAGGATTVALAATAFAIVASTRSENPACRDAAAAFDRAWSPAQRTSLQARFLATSAPFAADAFAAVERGIASFGARWTAMHEASCRATRVDGTQPDQIFALRTRCLEQSLAELAALVGVLSALDREALATAPEAVARLSTLDSCANVTALLAPVAPPTEAERAAIAVIDRDLARGRALRDARRWEEAQIAAGRAVAATNAITHQPTIAAALLLRGEAEHGAGDAKRAETTLRDAYAAAETGGDDLLAARIATELAFVIGQTGTRVDAGLDWAFHAKTSLARAGGDRDIEAQLENTRGSLRYLQADYAAAKQHYQRAVDLRIAVSGPASARAARPLFNLGRAAGAAGDNPEALALTLRAISILEADLGPRHPDVAQALEGLAAIQHNQGKYADALASTERAIAIAEPALGKQHVELAKLATLRGFALAALGRHTEALVAFEVSIAIYDRDQSHRAALVETLDGRGGSEHALGRNDLARASYERALALRIAVFGPRSDEAARSHESLGNLELALGKLAAARAHFTEALAIRAEVNPPDHFERAYALAGTGQIDLRSGKPAAAIPPLREAVTLLERYDGDPEMLAQTRFALAQALWDGGGDRAAARALAEQAARTLTDDAKLLAWLRAR